MFIVWHYIPVFKMRIVDKPMILGFPECEKSGFGAVSGRRLLKMGYTMLTDLESVFRSLKSELGMRPVYHHKEERCDGHLFITVLAYQAVQVIRRKLKEHGINESWATLREKLNRQCRVTATFKQRDGKTIHIRQATRPEGALATIYTKLAIPANPGGLQRITIQQNTGNVVPEGI